MAQVTMELRHVLMMTGMELFDFDYPIDDQAWKTALEAQFKDRFAFYEIGAETIDRFKHNLKIKFVEIMPYYNQLYNTTLTVINPLITSKTTETYTGNNNSTATTNNNSTGKEFDYPQNANPLTDIATNSQTNEGTTTFDNTGGQDYSKIIEGLSGDQSQLMKSYRDNILNINKLIMNECKSLFILVY